MPIPQIPDAPEPDSLAVVGLYVAFQRLSRTRMTAPGGPERIGFQEIVLYWHEFKPWDDKEEFIDYMLAMDEHLLKIVHEDMEKEQRKMEKQGGKK